MKTVFRVNFLLWVFVLSFHGSVFAQTIPFSAYVVNTLGENLSVINLENGTVNVNAVNLGMNSFANDIAIRDQRAYVVNSGLNEVRVIDLATLAVVQTIDVGIGTNPWSIEFINDSLAAVSLWLTNQVAIVNVNTGTLQQSIAVGTTPQGMAYVDGLLYVANAGFVAPGQFDPGTLSVIDVGSWQVVDTISVGLNPQAIQSQGDSLLVVVCSGDYAAEPSQLNLISRNLHQVVHSETLSVVGTNVGVNHSARAYITTFGSGTLVYHLLNRTFERDASNPLKGGPGVAFDSQDRAYLADFLSDSVFVYEANHQYLSGYLVGDGPVALALFEPGVTGLPAAPDAPVVDFELKPNYPNPFNPGTRIAFRLNRAEVVRLDVWNARGQRVKVLFDGYLPAGWHQVDWDGTDATGKPAASGIYYYRLLTPRARQSRAMLLLR